LQLGISENSLLSEILLKWTFKSHLCISEEPYVEINIQAIMATLEAMSPFNTAQRIFSSVMKRKEQEMIATTSMIDSNSIASNPILKIKVINTDSKGMALTTDV
jgi:hypothetical protein